MHGEKKKNRLISTVSALHHCCLKLSTHRAWLSSVYRYLLCILLVLSKLLKYLQKCRPILYKFPKYNDKCAYTALGETGASCHMGKLSAAVC